MVDSLLASARLKDARCARGFSQPELADALGVTSQSISQYENGARNISAEMIAKIAFVLNVPPSYFVGEKVCKIKTRGPLFFRAKKTIRSNKHRTKYEILTSWIAELYSWMRLSVETPALHLPTIDPKNSYSNEELEDIAGALRSCWGLGDGPIRNLVALIESNGVMAIRIDTTDIDTDAFSGYFDGLPYVFLNRLKNSASRTRFDIAHELAHILLHSHLTDEQLVDGLGDIEREADYFAGAFLMPAKTFSREVVNFSLAGLSCLKERWGTSVQAMIMRCYQLGLIDEYRKSELFRQISAKGWRRKEPNEDAVARDNSSVGQKAMRLLIEDDPYMVDRIQTEQLVSLALVRDAFDIPVEDLATSNIIEFSPKLRMSAK